MEMGPEESVLPFCEDCWQRLSYKELTLQRAVEIEGCLSCVGATAFRIGSVACIYILWARIAAQGKGKGY